MRLLPLAATAIMVVPSSASAHSHNIMLTGYWPPTNNMLRPFSQNPAQNPEGWTGENWEDRGYDIYSFFPEFPDGVGKGVGDFEVDYQDTSEDFWRIVEEVRPVAIITFSRGNFDRSWEVERRQRNLSQWIDDYEAPFQPTPSPPDASVPAGHIRESTLPMQAIVDAVNEQTTLNAYIDEVGFGGGFLSEFIAYHGVWYQSLHADPSDPYWVAAAGHIHVGFNYLNDNPAVVRNAMRTTLRTLTDYLDTVVPEPAAGLLMIPLLMVLRRR